MRHRDPAQTEALLSHLRRGPVGIAELAGQLGVSRRTVLRWLSERSDVSSAGEASRTRYALQRPLHGRFGAQGVYRIDLRGQVTALGTLELVWPEGSRFDLRATDWPVDADSRDGWWPGLPYPLYDMRPQGFLGRSFARQYHALLDVSADPRRWNDDDIVHILTRLGDDTSGNLIVGEPALQRWQDGLVQPLPALAEPDVAQAYLARVDAALALGSEHSSAAGEFPKFTARRALAGALTEHVIVKFSGEVMPGATQRWSDLLVCEHLACRHAGRLPGIDGARSRILQSGGRTFLESERFDRLGTFGRLPLVSLEAVNGHLLGSAAEDWRAPLRRLQALGLLALQQAEAGLRLWWFGRLIANSDMHFGNLSFHPEAGRLRLAPVYDMLPMAYAPLPGGELPTVPAVAVAPPPQEQALWQQAAVQALAFWEAAAADVRISPMFRALCGERWQSLAALQQRLLPM